jgi:hypothetical protein
MGTKFGGSIASPYLANSGRLADVIAAIQAMGTYKFYKLSFEGWADRITANKNQAFYWKNVFEQHPEFFRLDSAREKASLVWRRQYPKRFHVDLEKHLSVEKFKALPDDQKGRVHVTHSLPTTLRHSSTQQSTYIRELLNPSMRESGGYRSQLAPLEVWLARP